jgi:hypothetical protein
VGIPFENIRDQSLFVEGGGEKAPLKRAEM